MDTIPSLFNLFTPEYTKDTFLTNDELKPISKRLVIAKTLMKIVHSATSSEEKYDKITGSNSIELPILKNVAQYDHITSETFIFKM